MISATHRLQDSITGLLLAGIGHINEHQKKNFLVVDSSKNLSPV
jgi:V-type H+-transporting ATPase subunit F